MNDILTLIFSGILIIIGIRMYSNYYKKPEDYEGDQSKLFHKAVMVVITGILLALASISQFFK